MRKRVARILLGLLFVFLIIVSIALTPDRDYYELRHIYTTEASRFINVQGMDVHYQDEGTGFPIVLLHGTAASLHTWDDWSKNLKDDFRVIRMDLPAFGLTGPNKEGDYRVDTYVRFLNEFLTKLQIDSCYLVGNSLGGAIAWNYSATYPNQVKKLILIDAGGFPLPIPAVFELARKPFIAFWIKMITPRSLIRKNIEEVYYNDALVTDELIDRYYDLALRPGNRQAFIDRAQLDYFDNTDKLLAIQCPTLILWGENDQWIPVAQAFKFHNSIANSTLLIYPETGHVPMEERPMETLKDVVSFLD